MRNLNNLATFVQVAKYQSVTKASDKLHLTQQAVSYQVKKLEEALGVLLFKRAHRKIYLTQEGKTLLKTAEKHLTALEQDIFDAKYKHSVVVGHVKLGTTLELASLVLAPLIESFKLKHPQVSVEILLQDDASTVQNIIHNDTDLGIVVFSSEPQLLNVTPFKQEQFITLASTDFIKNHGPFTCFTDVINSEIIDYHADCPSLKTWLSKNDKKLVKQLATKSASIAANDVRLLKQFVMAGAGIANVPATLFADELKQGKVAEILPKSQTISASIDLIYMKDRVLPSHVSAFIEHLQMSPKMEIN
ncbi:LysR family transcriptional regulator [Paraglaciecola sp. 2405UD69-4]|uniref:LysR family transcriptional regulator n=1 Tax=Paraglaciecola sp. 2405UD69-4 TaxID=3391836 RepID=UPI0039C9E0B7